MRVGHGRRGYRILRHGCKYDNNFGEQEYGIAFRKGSDATEKVNAAIAELYSEGVVEQIAAKYGLTDILIK